VSRLAESGAPGAIRDRSGGRVACGDGDESEGIAFATRCGIQVPDPSTPCRLLYISAFGRRSQARRPGSGPAAY